MQLQEKWPEMRWLPVQNAEGRTVRTQQAKFLMISYFKHKIFNHRKTKVPFFQCENVFAMVL